MRRLRVLYRKNRHLDDKWNGRDRIAKPEKPDPNASKLDRPGNEAFTRLEHKDMSEPITKPKQTPATEPDHDGSRSSGGFSGVLGVLLALIAIGMASYPIYQMLQPRPAPIIDQSVQQLTRDQNDQRQQFEKLEQEMQSLTSIMQDLQSDAAVVAENAIKVQGQLREELLSMVGTTSQDWLIAEVEYLLRLANQRVLMERDPQGAIALLRAADDIVRDARGTTGFELREAIAFDLGQLDAVARLDVDGIYLQLSVLARRVAQLRQKKRHFEVSAPTPALPTLTTLTWTERFWLRVEGAGRRLATLVDYRRGATEVTPILPPKEEYYLRQNLVLKFQLAELALLRGDQAIYSNALAEAGQWITQYFDLNQPQTQAVQTGIEKLRHIDIAGQMPDISGSLQAARELMAKFSQQPSRLPSRHNNVIRSPQLQIDPMGAAQ